MKRSIITIILLILGTVALQSCRVYIVDPNAEGVNDPATLKIGIVTRSASTRADNESMNGVLGEAEYAIKSLRIFAFESTGELDTVDFVEYDEAITRSVFHTFVVRKAPEKLLYVVVNEPSGVFANIDEITTVDDLTDIKFTIAEAMNRGFNAGSDFGVKDFVIPMTAVATIDASGDRDVVINVDRAVARVDLMLDKNEDAKDRKVMLTDETMFQVSGVVLDSKLMASEVLTEPTLSDIAPTFAVISSEVEIPTEATDNSTAQRVLSFYVAERTYDKDDADTKITVKINALQIDGKTVDINNTIVLGEPQSSPLSKIQRNYIYKIYATYVGIEEEVIADQFTVVDWEYEELEGDIEGVIMSVENTLAMDWLRNGNSFAGPATSFGSNKPVSVLLPVKNTETSTAGNVQYDFVVYDFGDVSNGGTFDLMTLELENNFILELDWIESAELVFTSDRIGYVKVTYSTINTTYDLQTYPIRFKSGNVVKQMKVIYDNGYIPVGFLPEHWAERAPGGVVFAKRGYAQHPRDVEDVFFRDEDGYYRGDPRMVQADADAYCKQLGEMWYAPTRSDMEAMIPGVKELGTSYRFQDTGSLYGAEPTPALYWTMTESTETSGYYWCGNFIYNSKPIVDVYDWMELRSGTEENFVRCALDLK